MTSSESIRHGEFQAQNPFLNHLVIENIVNYTNQVSTLKSLRLLAPSWHSIISPKLMKLSIVNINSERQMKRYMDSFLMSRPHINFHVKVLQSMESDPVASFMKCILSSSEELHLSKCVMNPEEIMQIFILGKRLKTLSFNEIIIEGEVDDNDKFPSSTQLNRLEVITCEDGNLFPWTMVFKTLPNLQILHAQLQSSLQNTNLLESLLGQEVKLRELSSFLTDLTIEELNLLQALEFPLKNLDLSISSNAPTKVVEDLIKSPSLSGLETLKLFHETDGNINEINLPRLPQLKSLELLGDPVDASILSCIGRRGCCNLKNLNLSELANPDKIFNEKFEHTNLSSLSIEEGYLSKEILRKLSILFPVLKKACLFLNDENIGVLFKNCPALEEIIVLGTELTDLGIIGVNPSGRSCIGDCKRLRKFSLYPQPQDRITDMSIIHGLVHVPELAIVDLPETAITNEGLKYLLKAKPNLFKLSAKIAINPRTGEHSLRSTKYQIL